MTKCCGVFLITALSLFLGCGGGSGGGGGGTGSSGAETLVSIDVAPGYPSIEKNGTRPLKATGTYSGGGERDITGSVTWSSSNDTKAPVNSAGVVTGNTEGIYLITAVLEGVSGSTTVTVNGLAGVPYMPDQPVFSAASVLSGGTVNLTVTVTPDTSSVTVYLFDEQMDLIDSKLTTSLLGGSSVTVPFTIASVVPTGSLFAEIQVHASSTDFVSKYLASTPTSTVYSIYQENLASLPANTYQGPTGIPVPRIAVQNSAPNGTIYYLETFGTGTTDTVLEVYSSTDVVTPLVSNDEGGTGHYSALSVNLVKGQTYFILVRGFADQSSGPYSIRISDTGFGGEPGVNAGDPDAYEGDDSSTGSTLLPLNTVQNHTLSYNSGAYGDNDWFTFAP